MKITDHKEYMECVRNWNRYTLEEQEQLREWYRNYYSNNKDKERKRYRNLLCTEFRFRKRTSQESKDYKSKAINIHMLVIKVEGIQVRFDVE
jgi:hypothetical protein